MKEKDTKKIVLDLKKPHKMDSQRKKKLLEKTDAQIRKDAASDPDNPIISKEELKSFRAAIDVKALREKLNMSQRDFARTYRLTLSTIRDWEQGRSLPDQSSRTLLFLISEAPGFIAQKLQDDSRLRV